MPIFLGGNSFLSKNFSKIIVSKRFVKKNKFVLLTSEEFCVENFFNQRRNQKSSHYLTDQKEKIFTFKKKIF